MMTYSTANAMRSSMCQSDFSLFDLSQIPLRYLVRTIFEPTSVMELGLLHTKLLRCLTLRCLSDSRRTTKARYTLSVSTGRVHGPCSRLVNRGVILDACIHRPWTRVVCTELLCCPTLHAY